MSACICAACEAFPADQAASRPLPATRIICAGGSVEGNYYKTMLGIASLMSQRLYWPASVRITSGSQENAKLLQEYSPLPSSGDGSPVSFALVQDDVLYFCRNGSPVCDKLPPGVPESVLQRNREEMPALRSVARLFRDVVQVIVPAGDEAQSLSEFLYSHPTAKVAAGRVGSGTLMHSMQIFSLIDPEITNSLEFDIEVGTSDAINNLKDYSTGEGAYDIVFITARLGKIDVIEESIAQGRAKLLLIGDSLRNKVSSTFNYLQPFPSPIEDQIHPIQGNQSYQSLAVWVSLAASENVSPAFVEALLAEMFKGVPTDRQVRLLADDIIEYGSFSEWTVEEPVVIERSLHRLPESVAVNQPLLLGKTITNVPIPLHKGAYRYYRSARLIPAMLSTQWLIFTVILTVFPALLLTLLPLLRAIRRRSRDNSRYQSALFINQIMRCRYYLAFLLWAGLLLFGAQLYHLIEKSIQSSKEGGYYAYTHTFTDTLVWLYVLLATGIPIRNDIPQSTAGQLTASSILLVAIGGLVLILGFFTRDVLQQILGREKMDIDHWHGHVVVCGGGEHLLRILQELASDEFCQKERVVVVSEQSKPEAIDELVLEVAWIKGSPQEPKTLIKAGINRAKSAVILCDRAKTAPDQDAILTTLAIEGVCKDLVETGKGGHDVYTVAEVIEPKHQTMLQLARVDEIVCAQDFSEKLLVHAAINHGVARMLGSLLAYNSDMDIYEYRIADNSDLCGKSYDEALAMCRDLDLLLVAIQDGTPAPLGANEPDQSGCSTADANAAAARRDQTGGASGKLIINPPRKNQAKLAAGQRLILFANSGRDVLKLAQYTHTDKATN